VPLHGRGALRLIALVLVDVVAAVTSVVVVALALTSGESPMVVMALALTSGKSPMLVVVALALTSGKSPMLVQAIPTELSSRLLPHEPLRSQQNRTHGAVRLSAPAVLQ